MPAAASNNDRAPNNSSFRSPDENSPQMLEKRVEELMFRVDLASSINRFQSNIDQLFVLMSVVISTGNMFRFPSLCARHGGLAFLIPYGISCIVMSLPMLYVESALGQYCSEPPVQLFAHLIPAFGGLGYVFTAIFVFKVLRFAFEPVKMLLFFIVKTIIASSSSHPRWLYCNQYTSLHCFEPGLHCDADNGEYQFKGECHQLFLINNGTLHLHGGYSWEQTVVILTSTADALRMVPTELYLKENIFGYPLPSVYVMGSSAFLHVIVISMAIMGMRNYANISKFLVIYSQLVCVISFVVFIFISQHSSLGIEFVLGTDFSKIATLRAWTDAAIESLLSLDIAGGVMIALSSMKNFHNNIMRDVMMIVCVDGVSKLFSCFLMSQFLINFTAFKFPGEDTSGLFKKMQYFGGDWWELIYTTLPMCFSETLKGSFFMIVCLSGFLILSLGIQVIAVEMLIMSAYRFFPRLSYLGNQISRNFICGFILASSFLYIMPSSLKTVHELPFSELYPLIVPTPILALIEILIVMYIHRFKHFVVNLRTMLGVLPPTVLYRFLGYPIGRFWAVNWLFLTPCALLMVSMGIFLDGRMSTLWRGFRLRGIMISSVYFVILAAYLVAVVLKAHNRGENPKLSFYHHRKWGPALLADRQQAIRDERAVRAVM